MVIFMRKKEKKDIKNQIIRPAMDSNKTMRLNHFLANKYILIAVCVGIDLLLVGAFNYIINSTIELLGSVSSGMSIEECVSFNNILFRGSILRSSSGKLLYLFFIVLIIFVDVRIVYMVRTYFAEENFNVNQKGDSRWTTPEEIKMQYKEIPESKFSFEGRGGIPVFRQKDKLYIDDSIVNNLIIGMTRSGKGEMLVFPTIDILSRAEEKASLVITDPKLELYKSSYETLKKRGYEIYLLNLIDPDCSMGFNPLHMITETYKNKEYDKAETLARTFAYSIFNPDNAPGESAFFAKNASSLLTAMILAHIEDCLNEDKIINDIRFKHYQRKRNQYDALPEEAKKEAAEKFYKVLDTLEEKDDYITNLKIRYIPEEVDFEYSKENEKKITMFSIINTFTELASDKKTPMLTALDLYFSSRPRMDRAKLKYASIEVSADRTKGSIYSEMLSKLEIFTYQNLARMTAESTIDLKSVGFGEKPIAVFMGVPDYDRSNYFMVTVFVSQLYFVLAKEATFAGGKCKRHVKFLLDEFGNTPPIEGMASDATVSLGRNISFDLYIQAYSQMEKLYGDDAETIEGNCGNQIYILSNSTETAEKFSKLLGSETITDLQRSGHKLSLEKHITETLQEKPLLNANQLMELEEGCFVVKRSMTRKDRKGNHIRPRPIFNCDEFNSRFKYRYEYLIDEFPNPTEIDFYDICTEDRTHINVEERVWDFDITFNHFQEAEAEMQRGGAVPKKWKTLEDASKQTRDSIMEKYKEYTGERISADITIAELISKISSDKFITEFQKKALLAIVNTI